MRSICLGLLVLALGCGPALADGRAIRVELAAETGGGARAGEPAAVSVRVQDPASGFPLTGLTPALWLLPLTAGELEEGCEQQVNRLAGAAAPPRGSVDVNGFDLIQATSEGRLAWVDPLLNLASANLRGILDVGEVPIAWALEPGGRVLAVATAGDRRLRRIDLASFKQTDAMPLPAEPVAMVASAGTLWTGLADGSVLAGGPAGSRYPLGDGAVHLSATPLGALAVAASGHGAFLRGGGIAASVELGAPIRALGYSPLADSGYAVEADGRGLRVVPQDDPQAVRRIALPRPTRALAVAPEGRWIALVADDGLAVDIFDTVRDRIRWTIEVHDPVIAADFSDAFLYLMHARQGGASRVVFDPQGGPPGVVTIAAGSTAQGEQQAGPLPLLARIPAAGMLLASSRDRQAFMVNDDNAQAAMSSLPLRAGAPAGILLRYRGLEPAAGERGLYRADVVLPRGGDYMAVVRTERPALAHCARLTVAPADGEAPAVAIEAEAPPVERQLLADTGQDDDGQVLDFTITGSPRATLLAASLVGDGWQRTPRDLQRRAHGYRMRIDGAAVPFTLFVRYRDREGGPARVLATPVHDARSDAP
ncbi:hypothetical protein AAD027_09005 [Pseudoxanthomonas putridarboris]|uniref:Uncharacterized protein n=2 Tax=Pseudoxanthomonas putridarboris TaxID=752605 RepID=A0ABU9IZV3_9GAMM